MSTFALIPGAGGSSWYWHLVRPRLESHGHRVITPELPAADDSARLIDYVETVVNAVAGVDQLVVVGQSLGGLVAPLVCDRVSAKLLVLVAPMIPAPGETGGEWWTTTGAGEAAQTAAMADGRTGEDAFGPIELFLHDLAPDVLAEALVRPVEQNDGPFLDPCPLDAWPAVPTRVVACRYDRLFPLAFMQRLARDRLNLEPDVIDTGHLPALADPEALSALLVRYEREIATPPLT